MTRVERGIYSSVSAERIVKRRGVLGLTGDPEGEGGQRVEAMSPLIVLNKLDILCG